MKALVFFEGKKVCKFSFDEQVRITDIDLNIKYIEYIKDRKLIAQFDSRYSFVIAEGEFEFIVENIK